MNQQYKQPYYSSQYLGEDLYTHPYNEGAAVPPIVEFWSVEPESLFWTVEPEGVNWVIAGGN